MVKAIMVTVALCALVLAVVQVAEAKPHILLMVLDDIGRTDTGIYGDSNIPMPKLKSLASNGVILENFYTQTVCSPTRSSLMTGRYPFRFGMQHFTTQLPGMTAGVPLNTPMLPALLADQGYERHMIGKWHCGYASWEHTPMKRGFQSYTGYLQAQGDYYTHNAAVSELNKALGKVLDGLDFWHNTRPMFEARGNYSLDLYRDAMTKVLRGYAGRQDTPEKRKEHPLFVYLAHQTVHVPLQFRKEEPRCASISHKTRRIYCNMLVELDDAIGEMVEEYKALGLWDDLLIITMTDNGGMVNFASHEDNSPVFPASQGSNYPLRGSKTTMFDGGVRSLAFASGGYLPKEARGRRITALAHVVDISATILSAARVIPAKKEKLKIDGNSLIGLLMNRPNAMPLRDHIPINVVLGGKRYSAVRFGKYKLIVDDFFNPPAQGWFDKNGDLAEAGPAYVKGTVMLFDLEKDPQERTDIAKDNEHMVQYGKDLLRMYVEGGDYMEPQESFRLYARAIPALHGGVWKPFMDPTHWQESFERQKSKAGATLEEIEDYKVGNLRVNKLDEDFLLQIPADPSLA